MRIRRSVLALPLVAAAALFSLAATTAGAAGGGPPVVTPPPGLPTVVCDPVPPSVVHPVCTLPPNGGNVVAPQGMTLEASFATGAALTGDTSDPAVVAVVGQPGPGKFDYLAVGPGDANITLHAIIACATPLPGHIASPCPSLPIVLRWSIHVVGAGGPTTCTTSPCHLPDSGGSVTAPQGTSLEATTVTIGVFQGTSTNPSVVKVVGSAGPNLFDYQAVGPGDATITLEGPIIACPTPLPGQIPPPCPEPPIKLTTWSVHVIPVGGTFTCTTDPCLLPSAGGSVTAEQATTLQATVLGSFVSGSSTDPNVVKVVGLVGPNLFAFQAENPGTATISVVGPPLPCATPLPGQPGQPCIIPRVTWTVTVTPALIFTCTASPCTLPPGGAAVDATVGQTLKVDVNGGPWFGTTTDPKVVKVVGPAANHLSIDFKAVHTGTATITVRGPILLCPAPQCGPPVVLGTWVVTVHPKHHHHKP